MLVEQAHFGRLGLALWAVDEGAKQVVDDVRKAVLAQAISHPASNAAGAVSVSIGLATMEVGTDMDASSLLALADRRLYTAKHDGRNRVCVG